MKLNNDDAQLHLIMLDDAWLLMTLDDDWLHLIMVDDTDTWWHIVMLHDTWWCFKIHYDLQ